MVGFVVHHGGNSIALYHQTFVIFTFVIFTFGVISSPAFTHHIFGCLFLSSLSDVVALLVQQPGYVPSEYGLNKAFEAAYLQSHHSTVKTLLDYAQQRGAQLESEPVAFHKATAAARRAKRVQAGGLSVQKDEDRALRYAVRGNDVEMVRLLLDYGANVHAFQENSITVASQMGHVEILKLLVQAGADVAGTPLRYAAENGHSEVVRVLCESGADTMAGGCGSLRTAASCGKDKTLA